MKEVNPQDTTRSYAFELWMKAPMSMVTFFKTLDVSRLVRFSRKKKLKFNMLMCWCIGKAATQVKEFYTLPVGDRLIQSGQYFQAPCQQQTVTSSVSMDVCRWLHRTYRIIQRCAIYNATAQ